ncbi:MAG: hypothetical protein U0R23_12230 [Candidatus Nanopelagicales bacterium]
MKGWKAARHSPSTGRLNSLHVTGPARRRVKVQKKASGTWANLRVLRTTKHKVLHAGFIHGRPGHWRLRVPARGPWGATTTTTVHIPGTSGGQQAPASFDDSAPYGTSFNADTLANLNMGGKWDGTPSYRFTAEQSSTLNAVRVHLLEPTHGNGYAAGTGGTIRMTVQTDNGGVPSGDVLASREFQWSDANGSNFPLFRFGSPARLTAGQRYHLVFNNIDSSPASNYMSLNNMYTFTEPTPRQSNHSDSAFFTTLMKEGSAGWKVWNGYTPNVDLTYGNGAHQGQGVMDIDTAHGSVISGRNEVVRERITVSDTDRVVSGAAVRIARTSGSGDLVVSLENANGDVIDSFSADTSSVPVIDSSQDGKAGVWVSGNFSASHTLSKGSTYNLRLSTNSGTTLWTRGIQQGKMYDFDPSTYFADGELQVSDDAGSNWDVVPGLWKDGDLQFYFN